MGAIAAWAARTRRPPRPSATTAAGAPAEAAERSAPAARTRARGPKLLLAGEIEMAERADGRGVAKDPEEIELALLRQRRPQPPSKSQLRRSHLARVGIVGRSPGRLAHLQLDLLQELLDAAR